MSKKIKLRKQKKASNPIALALRSPLFSLKSVKTGEDRERQLDPWERCAKYKKPDIDGDDDG